jgi:fructose-bisphosphate aldolase class I
VICQENGLVPIIEPEVLIDGTHDISTCAKVSEKVFAAVIKECQDQGVFFEGALLKPNMITAGAECPTKASNLDIAWITCRTLSRTIPAAIPGIVFLSGGQSEQEASENLNEMNLVKDIPCPWNLSFSYGRALQASVLKCWLGKEENYTKSQEVFIGLCKNNSQATEGKYVGSGNKGESLYVKNYTY